MDFIYGDYCINTSITLSHLLKSILKLASSEPNIIKITLTLLTLKHTNASVSIYYALTIRVRPQPKWLLLRLDGMLTVAKELLEINR